MIRAWWRRVSGAVRSFRTSRSAGGDPWTAAEEALSQLAPRRLARVLLFEVRLIAALSSGWTHQHGHPAGHAFSYHGGLAILIWTGFALVAVEGAVVGMVLAIALPHTAWPWIALAAHCYGLLWLAGLYASMLTRPHLFGDHALRTRDGIFTEVVIPYPALLDARAGQASQGFRLLQRAFRPSRDAQAASHTEWLLTPAKRSTT